MLLNLLRNTTTVTVEIKLLSIFRMKLAGQVSQRRWRAS